MEGCDVTDMHSSLGLGLIVGADPEVHSCALLQGSPQVVHVCCKKCNLSFALLSIWPFLLIGNQSSGWALQKPCCQEIALVLVTPGFMQHAACSVIVIILCHLASCLATSLIWNLMYFMAV